MQFPYLDSVRLVNWNGKNRSHMALFNLSNVSPSRSVHLTIETTDAHYLKIRRKTPRGFFISLIRFAAVLKSRGIFINRISLFPGPEEGFVANMNYFFPAVRLHVGTPPRIFVKPFESYGIPNVLYTIFPSDKGLVSRAGESMEDGIEEDDSVPTAPQLAINSQTMDVAAPLERGYSSIREFLVTEVDRQSQMLCGRARPSTFSISVAWKGQSQKLSTTNLMEFVPHCRGYDGWTNAPG